MKAIEVKSALISGGMVILSLNIIILLTFVFK